VRACMRACVRVHADNVCAYHVDMFVQKSKWGFLIDEPAQIFFTHSSLIVYYSTKPLADETPA